MMSVAQPFELSQENRWIVVGDKMKGMAACMPSTNWKWKAGGPSQHTSNGEKAHREGGRNAAWPSSNACEPTAISLREEKEKDRYPRDGLFVRYIYCKWIDYTTTTTIQTKTDLTLGAQQVHNLQ